MFNVLNLVDWFRVKNHAEMRLNANVEALTRMKVMKLLYYVQGISLVYRNQPAFQDAIIATQTGPMIHQICQKYQKPSTIIGHISTQDLQHYQQLTQHHKLSNVLNTVWETYGDWSTLQIMHQIKQQPPWIQTPLQHPINLKQLQKFFTKITVIEA